MARDMENRIFAEPEIVDSSVDLGGFSPQVLQNQFAVQPQQQLQNQFAVQPQATAAAPVVDLGNYDFSGLGLGNYNFGNFDLSAFQQQYGAPEPVYSQPTPQPVQTVPYYGDQLATEFVPPNRTYGYDPMEPASTYSPTDTSFDPYNIGSFGASPYAQPTTTGTALTSAAPASTALPTAAANYNMPTFGVPQYSDTTKQYLDQVNQLVSSYKPTLGSFYSTIPTATYSYDDMWGQGFATPQYATEEELANYLNKPPEQNLVYTVDVPSNKNKSTGAVSVSYNTPIALVDNSTGQVVKAGVGFDAAQQIAEMARQLSQTQGKKAQWSIYTAPPGATDANQFKPVATEKKDKSFLGSILSIAAPVLGSILLPGIGGGIGAALTGALGSVGTGALGAALGSAALGTARGESIGDILKKAALSGAGAFAGGSLGNAIGVGSKTTSGLTNAASKTTEEAAKQALQQGVTKAASGGLDEIVVNALINKTPQLIGSGLGTAGSTALTSILNSMPAMQWKPDNLVDLGNGQSFDIDTGEIIVTGSRGAGAGGTGALIGSGLGGLTGGAAGGAGDIVVTGQPGGELPPTETNVGAGAGGIGGDIVVEGNPGSKVNTETTAGSTVGGLTGDIVVTADKVKLPSDTTKIISGIGAGLGGALSGGGSGGGNTGGSGKSTIGKVVGGLTIADALAKILGKLAGGGGKGGTSPGGQGLQNVFTARLPKATGIFDARNLGPRDMSGTDWLRYGYGPEKAFFQNVPTSGAERTALVNAYRPSNLPLSAMGGMPPGATTAPGDIGPGDAATLLNQLSADLAAAGVSEADFNAFLQTPEGQRALMDALGGVQLAKGGSLSAKRSGTPRESFAVEGPGTGRSDEIPAALSDGEYVIDAETVALLGDGSSKAGAKKLDEFRVNVRKHKGRNLAKGKFSVNAKRPEKYLSGGRT